MTENNYNPGGLSLEVAEYVFDHPTNPSVLVYVYFNRNTHTFCSSHGVKGNAIGILDAIAKVKNVLI